MNRKQLEQAVQRARLLREDIQAIRSVYDDPMGSLEGIQVEDAGQVQDLFFELVGTLREASFELNEMFSPKRVRLDREVVTLNTPVPRRLRMFRLVEDDVIDLNAAHIAPPIWKHIHQLQWIPPWEKDPPIP